MLYHAFSGCVQTGMFANIRLDKLYVDYGLFPTWKYFLCSKEMSKSKLKLPFSTLSPVTKIFFLKVEPIKLHVLCKEVPRFQASSIQNSNDTIDLHAVNEMYIFYACPARCLAPFTFLCPLQWIQGCLLYTTHVDSSIISQATAKLEPC